MDKACIYHFSANPEAKVCKNHVEEIKDYAAKQGHIIEKVYIDGTLKQSEKKEHVKMMKEAGNYSYVYFRDIFHLSKHTVTATSYIKELQQKGVTVSSMHSGEIVLDSGEEEYVFPHNVLFYHSKMDMADERVFETQKAIVELFCREKTNWTIMDYIYEESEKKSVRAQPKLWELGDISDRYDLIIVQSFARLDLRTARFEKIIASLNIPVYSLQEGLLTVRRKE